MPLSFFTKNLIEMKYNDLLERIELHNKGTNVLCREAFLDYTNDEKILRKLLNGTYEEMEEDNKRMHRNSLMGG